MAPKHFFLHSSLNFEALIPAGATQQFCHMRYAARWQGAARQTASRASPARWSVEESTHGAQQRQHETAGMEMPTSVFKVKGWPRPAC